MMLQILLVIEKVKIDQCWIHLDFSEVVDCVLLASCPGTLMYIALVSLCSYLLLVIHKKAMEAY